MTLPLPYRIFNGLALVAHKLGKTPTAEQFLAKPLAERAAEKPPAWVLHTPPTDVSTEDRDIPTRDAKVLVRVYRPERRSGRGVLYLHGGGFTVGSVESCHHFLLELASRTGDVFVSVNYRLAPDDPFPAGLDDCEDAFDWVLAHADELGIDPARVAIAGDSAGGNLTAALCLRRRDTGRTQASKQVIIYPMLDLTCSRASWVTEGRPPLTKDLVVQVMKAYAGTHHVTEPELSPLFAAHLGGLPPALVVTAQHDTLRDDGNDYAARLLEDGTPARLVEYPNMPHGFLSLPKLTKTYDPCLRVVVEHLSS